VVRTWLIGFGVGVGIVGAAAQAPQSPQSADPSQIRVRQQIFVMEGALERAVQLGVDNLRRRLRAIMPDDALLQGGAPQVRGFRLDGYGVFFDVEVPAVRRSLAWSLRTMNETGLALARDLAQMRAFIQAIADPRMRTEFDRMLQRIQRQMAPPMQIPPPIPPAPPVTPGRVAAAQSQPAVAVQALPAPDPTAPLPPVDAAVITDPGEVYTQEVKAALIDAMIEQSGALTLGADEWLAVAARDSAPGTPLVGERDGVTVILRLKGSDLAAFRAGKLTLEQVKARVVISEF
jgi:hypothetical protein